MFSKKKRIDKKLFEEIFKNGQRLSGQVFNFCYIKSNSPRYSFVVSKKISSKAVVRNKLRRKGYNLLKNFIIQKNQGIFFYKKNELKNLSSDLIKKDLHFLLKKSKTI